MENITSIVFDSIGNPTITLNDGTVTSYVVATTPTSPTQTVTLTAGQTLEVIAQ